MEQIEANIAVLLTIHDMENKTLRCLENLYKQVLPNYLCLDIYLANDGCTDGILEAIKRQFPKVHVIKGGGNLLWNRGMYRTREEAVKQDYDFYLQSNDDNYLFDGALFTSLDNSAKCNHQAVVIAPMRLREKGVTTYSRCDGSQRIAPNGKLQRCERLNGSCVLIPQCIFKKVGNLGWTYRCATGGIDYGYRVRGADFKNYIATGYLSICENNPELPARARKEVPFTRRVKSLYSPLGYVEPIPFFLFEKGYIEFVIAVKHFTTAHIRALFPQLWKQ